MKIFLGNELDTEHIFKTWRHGHEFVDLGLSVCWATMNVGARASYECGKAYTWGAIHQSGDYPRFRYECCMYKYTKYVTDSHYGDVDYLTTLLPCDDVAHKKMGGDWRICFQRLLRVDFGNMLCHDTSYIER